MSECNFRLHVDRDISFHPTFDAAKTEARKHMSKQKALRIVEFEYDGEGLWWAYIYESGEWKPS